VVNVPEPVELEDAVLGAVEVPDAEVPLLVELDVDVVGEKRLVIVCVAVYAIVPLSDCVCATVARETVP